MESINLALLSSQYDRDGSTVSLITQQSRLKVPANQSNLEIYYEAIGCSLIDVTEVKLLDTLVSIIIDDEGVFKPDDALSELTGRKFSGRRGFRIIDDYGVERILFGKIVLAGLDTETGTTIGCPLTSEEVNLLILNQRIKPVILGLQAINKSEISS